MTEPQPAKVAVSDVIVRTLQAEQVDVVFGICAGYLFWLLRSLDRAGIRTVPSRHEGAAAFAAAGYSQASGHIGVVFGQGPGTTNTVTGVACALHDSVPMLVVAAQAPQDQYCADAHQEATGSNLGVDQGALFEPATRAVFRCASPASTPRTLRRALAIAHAERGPVMLDIPANLLASSIEPDDLAPAQYRATRHAVDVAGIAELVELLARAERPLLVIGNRATHRGISDALRGLCEDHDLPFVVMDFAKGIIPEDHPLSVGVAGWSGHGAALEALESSDLVITLGARLDSKATINYQRSLFRNLVQIDEEPAEIGRNLPVRLAMIADIPSTVNALREALRARKLRCATPTWIPELHARHGTYAEPRATELGAEGLGSAAALHVLRKALPREAMFVGDSGMNLMYLKRYLPVYRPDGFFCMYGWAAMGSGLPLSIGVQIARPDDVVVCVVGDGGFLVHVGELQVLAEYKLPVICVVLNNAGYHSVRLTMSRTMSSTYGCDIAEIDAAKIAESFGCAGYTVRSADELTAALERALAERRPAVIDVKVTGDRVEDVMLPSVQRMVSKVYGRDG